jgi:hypothetical protein
MPYKKVNGIVRYRKPRRVRLPRLLDKLILMISLFGEDIASVIMQQLTQIMKNDAITFRESNTERFKQEYRSQWYRIMKNIQLRPWWRLEIGLNVNQFNIPQFNIPPFNPQFHIIQGPHNHGGIHGYIMNQLNNVYLVTGNIPTTTDDYIPLLSDEPDESVIAQARDYPLRKYDKKKPPVMDKRSKKARSAYLKRESRRQMKMIAKR